MVWEWLSHFVHLEHVREDILQNLKYIEIEMVKTDTQARGAKILGNVLGITGAVAAPFTMGLSLVVSGVGIGVNVVSTFTESSLLSFYVEKAQKELEKYENIKEGLNKCEVDWPDLVITLGKSVIDAAIIDQIRRHIPKVTWEMIKNIPKESFIKTLSALKTLTQPFFTKLLSVGIPDLASKFSSTLNVARRISGEIAEEVSKLVSKKILTAIICVSVIFDIVDIIRIWRKDRPEAIKQVQRAIEALEG